MSYQIIGRVTISRAFRDNDLKVSFRVNEKVYVYSNGAGLVGGMIRSYPEIHHLLVGHPWVKLEGFAAGSLIPDTNPPTHFDVYDRPQVTVATPTIAPVSTVKSPVQRNVAVAEEKLRMVGDIDAQSGREFVAKIDDTKGDPKKPAVTPKDISRSKKITDAGALQEQAEVVAVIDDEKLATAPEVTPNPEIVHSTIDDSKDTVGDAVIPAAEGTTHALAEKPEIVAKIDDSQGTTGDAVTKTKVKVVRPPTAARKSKTPTEPSASKAKLQKTKSPAAAKKPAAPRKKKGLPKLEG